MKFHLVNDDQTLITKVQPHTDPPEGNAALVQVASGSGILLYDASGNPLSSTVNEDRTTDLDGVRGLNTNAMLFGRVDDDVVKNARLDALTEALMTITYAHHEIHAGSHYFVDNATDLSINNVLDVQFTTPNTTKWSHMVFSLDVEAETEWHFYEDATINVVGTPVIPINNNRNSSNVSGNTVGAITNGSVALANADTDVSGATEIAHGVVGSGRDAGKDSRENEIILRQNTVYCFRAIALSAGFVDFRINWYEHTNRN